MHESDSSAAAREERVKRAVSSVSRYLAMNFRGRVEIDTRDPRARRVP